MSDLFYGLPPSILRILNMEENRRPKILMYFSGINSSLTLTNTQSETTAIGAVLYDIFGQEKTSSHTMANNSMILDVGTIPNGIYILKIIGNKGIEVTKHISIER